MQSVRTTDIDLPANPPAFSVLKLSTPFRIFLPRSVVGYITRILLTCWKKIIWSKVWRYTGEKWSRQSEELPLHRVLDLSILICRSLEHFREAYRYKDLYDPEKPVIDRVGLQGDAMNVEICTDNERINEDIKLFSQALSDDDELIGERLRTLSKILKDMGY